MKKLPVFKTVFNAFGITFKNIHRTIGVTIISIIPIIIAVVITYSIFTQVHDYVPGIFWRVLLFSLATTFNTLYFFKYAINILRGHKKSGGAIASFVQMVKNPGILIWKYPLTIAVTTLIYIALTGSLLMFGIHLLKSNFLAGILLIIFSSVIVQGFLFASGILFAPFSVIDKANGPLKAIAHTWRIFKGNRWRAFFASLLSVVIFLVLLAVAVVLPVYMIYMTGSVTFSIWSGLHISDSAWAIIAVSSFLMVFFVIPSITFMITNIYVQLLRIKEGNTHELEDENTNHLAHTTPKGKSFSLMAFFGKVKAFIQKIIHNSILLKIIKWLLAFGIVLSVMYGAYYTYQWFFPTLEPATITLNKDISQKKIDEYLQKAEEKIAETGKRDIVMIVGRDLVYTYKNKLHILKGSDCECNFDNPSQNKCDVEEEYSDPHNFGENIVVNKYGAVCAGSEPGGGGLVITKNNENTVYIDIQSCVAKNELENITRNLSPHDAYMAKLSGKKVNRLFRLKNIDTSTGVVEYEIFKPQKEDDYLTLDYAEMGDVYFISDYPHNLTLFSPKKDFEKYATKVDEKTVNCTPDNVYMEAPMEGGEYE